MRFVPRNFPTLTSILGRRQERNTGGFGSGVQIWDVLSTPKGQKVELKTKKPHFLTWYACGPTVYDSAHIGHASSYIRLDVIRRILERQNISVVQVMGITDIDDKIILRAQKENVPWNQIGKKYEAEFLKDLRSLNIKSPHVRARVSDFVPNIISFISELLSAPKPLAYRTSDGSVYFDNGNYEGTPKFRQAVASADADPLAVQPDLSEFNIEKKDRRDFALWKGCKPGEPYWETPWGRGRPGWHIECSVMASYFFGQHLDVHSGGVDLVFPHHECEEAQCCAKFGHNKWVSHWIHTGHLYLGDSEKMSKSIGNTITIGDFLEHNSAESLRMLCVLSRYYQSIEYSAESLMLANSVLKKFQTFVGDCNAALVGAKKIEFKPESESILWEKLLSVKTKTDAALIDNFDTPYAIKLIMEAMNDLNRYLEPEHALRTTGGFDCGIILAYRALVVDFLNLVGITSSTDEHIPANSEDVLLEPVLSEFITFRKSVRTYSLALDEDKQTRKTKITERRSLMEACDNVRDNLASLGIEVKDHGKDSSWNIMPKLKAVKKQS